MGIQSRRKRNTQEDNLTRSQPDRRQPLRETASDEDNIKGRQPECLDLLFIETAFSNSALIEYKAVHFFILWLSQISSSPEDRREIEAKRKDSSGLSSNLRDLASDRFLS